MSALSHPVSSEAPASAVALNAEGLDYRQLNADVRRYADEGAMDLDIRNVCGQRYIGGALDTAIRLRLHGTPGQNLGAFMRGPRIRVEGNAQDGVGNTMDDGEVQVNGHAGDVLGYAMRGGRILVRGDVGYRVGIHMKAYADRLPVIVIGGKAGDFLGEYMAGGMIVVLGLDTQYPDAPLAGRRLGTGMHGGCIFVRGEIPAALLGHGLHLEAVTAKERGELDAQVRAWAEAFGRNADAALDAPFNCVRPASGRPYGNLYTGTN